jgi:radical SAM superfamily enzyme YgiQ (UPF0313 family)
MTHFSNQKYDMILVWPKYFTLYQPKFLPFGCMFVADSLRKAGYHPRVFDARTESSESLAELMLKNNPLWVGFYAMTGPSITDMLDNCKKIRALSQKVKILCGGPQPTLLPENTLNHELLDFVIVGEGEKTAIEFTQALQNRSPFGDIAGLGYKKNGQIIINRPREFIKDWDGEVALDWTDINVSDYIQDVGGYKRISLITSRGCPFRCAFCWNLKGNNRKWRAWTAEYVINLIKPLLQIGVSYISFVDDYFAWDLQRAEKVMLFLKENNVRWSFDGFRAGNHITPTLMQSFKNSGGFYLGFGAECGTQKMLDYVKKDLTIEQLLESARITGDAGIGAAYSWVIGFPNETEEDRMAIVHMIDRMTELNPLTTHYINIFSPYPGSQLYQETIDAGWTPPARLEDWALLREETTLPYYRNMWRLKSIAYSCYFKFADSPVRPHAKTKSIFAIPSKIFKFTASLRWRLKFFDLPVEYMLMSFVKNNLDRLQLLLNKYIKPL